jgi:hypothetical protein
MSALKNISSRTLSLLSLLALVACSDDTAQQSSNNGPSCLAGERYNPISGRCEPRASSNNNHGGDLGPDLGGDLGEDMAVEGDMVVTDMADMTQTPDFSIMPPEGCMPGGACVRRGGQGVPAARVRAGRAVFGWGVLVDGVPAGDAGLREPGVDQALQRAGDGLRGAGGM